MARPRLLGMLFAFVLLAAACGETTAIDDVGGRDTGAVDGAQQGVHDDGDSTAGEEGVIEEGDWYLVEASGPGTEPLPAADRDITMTVDGGQLAGSAGCNSYSADYTGNADRISVGEVVRTEMACEPPEVMAAEEAYLDALAQVDSAVLADDELVLSGAGRELRFAVLQLPTAPIDDGSG